MKFENTTAVVTGGSRGIGRAIVLELAKCGANVAILYSGNTEKAEETRLDATEFGVDAKAYRCDVSSASEVDETVKQILADFGKVEILVNNAGINRDKLLVQMSEEDFDSVVNVNLKGTFLMCRALARSMAKNRCGHIINITSDAGLMGNPGQANYASSKAGVIGLTKTIAREYASRGITCNAVAPGFIATDMTAAMPANVLEKAAETIPLKRVGKPEDIAHLVTFLASDLASYITGEVIKADGGLYI